MQCVVLNPKVFESAIGRGKGKIRAESSRNRQLEYNAENFDRWQIYELLKANNVEVDSETVRWIEGMDKTELKEGVIKYLLARNRTIGQ